MRQPCRVLIVLLAVVFYSICSFSISEAYKGDAEDVIVSGRVEKQIAPDMAKLNFTVFGAGKTADEAVKESAEKMALAKRALLGLNILSEQIEYVNYSLQPQYDDKGHINGYKVVNSVKVTINTIDKIGSVIDKLASVNIDKIGNIEFSVKDKDLLVKQLLSDAVENARQKATILANAGGRSLGRMLSVATSSYSNPVRIYNTMNTMAKADVTEIAVSNIDMFVSVDAVFALE